MNKRCLIVGAGSFKLNSFEKTENEYIIAADGGYKHLQNLGIEADLVLGDFDSLGFLPSHPNIVQHKAEKDDTDMMLAVKTALEMGFRQIFIYGGLGGRLDHTLASIQTLNLIISSGARAYLIGEGVVITLLENSKIDFTEDCKGYVSLFSQTEKTHGINISGLKYELENAELSSSMTLGVSNEFMGRPAFVSVEDGRLLIIWQRDVSSNLDSLGVLD